MGAAPGALNTSRSSPDQLTGPSPLGEAGLQYGFDISKENDENQKLNQQYLTLVYSNRRPSDTALVGIMLDPILSHLFRNYLYKHFKEALFNFWTECNSYTQIHAGNIETKKAAAAHIYTTFLAADAPYSSDFQLDAPTKDQITADLNITIVSSGTYKVKQSSERILKDVFRFPAGKIFQILKFDYLSEFLLSKEFQNKVNDLISENVSQTDVITRKTVRDELVDIETVIQQPAGMHYFLRFARENGLFGGQAQYVFDLLYEMNHYDATDDPATKMKRLKKIISRYKDFDFLLEISHLIKKAKKNNYKEPEREGKQRSMLDGVRKEIMQLLDNYAVPFKMSSAYREFKASKTEAQSESTFNKVRKFAKERNLEAKSSLSFSQVLENRIGRAYFKNYAEKNLMEESIGFWLEIQRVRSETSSMLIKKATKEEIQKHFEECSEHLIESYIVEGSEEQVNISDGQRAETLIRYEAFKKKEKDFNCVFQIAEKEILDLLKRNLWNGFRANKQFAYLSEKLLERDTRSKSKFNLSTENLLQVSAK